MIDLLHADRSAPEIAAELKGRNLRLLPAMGDPRWELASGIPAAKRWMAQILPLAEDAAARPLPELTDELYADFYRTGARLPFEVVYFERRKRLARIAMACLLGGKELRERMVPALVQKIEGIMEETSWTLPAHAWEKPDGKDPFKIDLFSAETANVMAELLNVFGRILPSDLQQKIRTRLREQFFENYLKPRSEITWKELPMNWNAVCHQGVIGAALAAENDDSLVAEILAEAAGHLRVFLGGFGEDGSTSEGPGYWSYGFGRFAELNAQIETATRGGLSFFGDDPLIRRIGQFAPALVLSGGQMANFSDGDRKGRLGPELLAYLGERLDLPPVRDEAAFQFAHLAAEGIDPFAQRCDFFYLARLFLRCPENLENRDEPARPDVFFPDYGAIVCRDPGSPPAWEFAAKAGHNAEHHNHNDCGSFIFQVKSFPAILEIGAPEYVGPYFSSNETRYTFLAARSLGHSVPLVNGFEQVQGADFSSTVLRHRIDADRVEFVVDLTKCYPPQAGCSELVRSFVIDRASGKLRLTDSFIMSGEGTVESIIICAAPVGRANSGAVLDLPVGEFGVDPGAGTVFLRAETCAYRDHSGKPAQVERLRFGHVGLLKSGVLSLEMRLVPSAEYRGLEP